jgi:hypothetical protein
MPNDTSAGIERGLSREVSNRLSAGSVVTEQDRLLGQPDHFMYDDVLVRTSVGTSVQEAAAVCAFPLHTTTTACDLRVRWMNPRNAEATYY